MTGRRILARLAWCVENRETVGEHGLLWRDAMLQERAIGLWRDALAPDTEQVEDVLPD